jgi:tRNA dimethylallyltransferase
MVLRGWLEEVVGLVRIGVPLDAKPFDYIGYGGLRARLEGTITFADATNAFPQATRRYVKRQVTWFRKESLSPCFPGFGDYPAIVTAAEQLVTGQLRSGAAA